MCGIGGILRVWPPGTDVPPPDRAIPEFWLDILDESIKHRGPDGHGRFRDRVLRTDGATVDVALVHRRMSIIDLAGGGQPMISERGRDGTGEGLVAVVFNGCIYNHRELRGDLELAGHRFVTDHSDTEVLIHGWREWGKDLPTKLEGMFAFAVWDRAKHSLLLARDHYGEKPLYQVSRAVARWTEERERGAIITYGPKPEVMPTNEPSVAFASTILALDRLESAARIWVRPSPDPEGEEPWTESAQAVEQVLTEGAGSVRDRRYWGWPAEFSAARFEVHGQDAFWPDGFFIGDHAADQRLGTYQSRSLGGFPFFGNRGAQPRGWLTVDKVDTLLRQAVARRVEADVPLGAFLSGGVDSSLVSLFAREKVGRLRTFCVRMPDPAYDESAFAAQAASVIGSDHTTLECVARPADDLVHLIKQLGLPFVDSSLLPTYWVARAARDHVKVVLTGDGGDELFVGYERQMAWFLLKRWGWAISMLPKWAFSASNPKSSSSKVRRLIGAARYDGVDSLRWVFQADQLRKLLPETHRRHAPAWNPVWMAVQMVAAVFGSTRSFSSALHHELGYLTEVLLKKVDAATMAVPLESRAPFLDTDLGAAVHAANPLDLVPGRERKGLLKQVARRYFPPELVDRPKMGFAIPIGDWFRSDFGGMKMLLLDHLSASDPWPGLDAGIDRGYVRQMIDEHVSGGTDHSQRLYALLVLSIWARSQAGTGLGQP